MIYLYIRKIFCLYEEYIAYISIWDCLFIMINSCSPQLLSGDKELISQLDVINLFLHVAISLVISIGQSSG